MHHPCPHAAQRRRLVVGYDNGKRAGQVSNLPTGLFVPRLLPADGSGSEDLTAHLERHGTRALESLDR